MGWKLAFPASQVLWRLRWPIGLTVVLLVAALLPMSSDTRLVTEINNAAHTLGFSLLAGIWVVNLRDYLSARRWHSITPYVLTAFVCTALGILIELTQLFGSRDADLGDLVADLVGIAAGLLLFLSIEWFEAPPIPSARIAAIAMLLVVVAVLLFSIAVPARWALAYLDRNKAFPTLIEFSRPWAEFFVRTRNVQIEPIIAPPSDFETRGAIRLRFQPGRSPGLELTEPYPDWQGFETLNLRVRLDSQVPHQLIVRIDDASHDQSVSDRFNGSIILKPGWNDVGISLDEIRSSPISRAMQMSRISRIVLFIPALKEPVQLVLSDIWLQ